MDLVHPDKNVFFHLPPLHESSPDSLYPYSSLMSESRDTAPEVLDPKYRFDKNKIK